jgi:hypothetical protein
MWIIVGKNEMYLCLCGTAQVHCLVAITWLHHEWYCLVSVFSCRCFCGCFVHSTLTRCSQTFVMLGVLQDNNVCLTQFSRPLFVACLACTQFHQRFPLIIYDVYDERHIIVKLQGYGPLTLQILPASNIPLYNSSS